MLESRSAATLGSIGSLSIAHERVEYVFGPYRLDPSRELLKFGSKVIPLPIRLFALLHALIKADGNLVTRETLSSLIWPEGGMDESNLSQHIYMLRQILGESAREHQFIITVHGKGFRFAAPVTVLNGVHANGSPVNRAPMTASGPENPLHAGYDAFASYSRGTELLERPNAANLALAIEQFNAALGIDGAFAPALVGLARAFALKAQYGYAPGNWVLPQALDAIGRALAIAPSSPAAHAVNARVTLLALWDWEAAKNAIDTAMSLNEASPLVHAAASFLHECAGDYTNASIELQHALVLAPYSFNLQFVLGRLLFIAADYERGAAHFSHLLEKDPTFQPARAYRAECYVLTGRLQDALAELYPAERYSKEDLALRLPLLCRTYADAGNKKAAEATYEQLVEASRTSFVSCGCLALCAIALERYEEALDYLKRALASREPSLLLMRNSPWFARVSSSEQFVRVLGDVKPRR
ncbi:MAG: winged helix-turn-helix domain-containing protein [Candidatus Eremiobacteraeota bacterium]|nr:winged helix-turn-helix domain-containing protein [Candidatus Eremiobacteraeota bacterium]